MVRMVKEEVLDLIDLLMTGKALICGTKKPAPNAGPSPILRG
jgi:hypothetical protein